MVARLGLVHRVIVLHTTKKTSVHILLISITEKATVKHHKINFVFSKLLKTFTACLQKLFLGVHMNG